MTLSPNHALKVALEAATEAGKILHEKWNLPHTIHVKGLAGDLVTEVDRASEKIILDIIASYFPDHATLSEEAGAGELSSPYKWVIDPLDGTTNYTHQYPMVAVSIALLHQGTPLAAVVYNPILNECFQAAKGAGAFLNNQPIQVSTTSSLQDSLLATGFAYDRVYNPDNNLAEFCLLTNSSQGVRRAGSAALDLAFVACGRLDGFWELGLKIWDTAAGVLLIQEAGGQVSAYDESPLILKSGRILASNGIIHHDLSQALLSVCRKE